MVNKKIYLFCESKNNNKKLLLETIVNSLLFSNSL